MSQTPSQIYNQLVQIKEQEPLLSGLTSNSITALWRVFYGATATGLSLMTQIWDVFKADLEYQKSTTPIYTPSWWNDQMINTFQFSPSDPTRGVIQINDQFQVSYQVIDPTTNIIAFSSTIQATNNRQVTIKVASNDGNGNPQQLTQDQLSAAASFVDRKKGAGLLISVVSFPADILTLDIDIYYDGQYVQSTVKSNVQAAITTYLQQLPFDGTIVISKLFDAIQSVQGVNDLLINSANGTPDGGQPIVFDRVYATNAGYASFDATNSIINLIQN
jgi:hypothetical protein